MNTHERQLNDLLKHLLKEKTPKQMESALRALLTDSELDEITKRLQIFKRLQAGIPQRQIAEELGVGIATVTRGSNALKHLQPQKEF